jgi:hypothetical protein
VALGELGALHDRAADPEIAEGACEPQHDDRERHEAEVGRGKQPSEQHTDGKLKGDADQSAGGAPSGGAGRAIGEGLLGHVA